MTKIADDLKNALTSAVSGVGDVAQTTNQVAKKTVVDTLSSGGDVATPAYFTGGFDESKLVLGSAHTIASIKEGLRTKGIHLLSVQTTY